jgi:hypothetical protein
MNKEDNFQSSKDVLYSSKMPISSFLYICQDKKRKISISLLFQDIRKYLGTALYKMLINI